MLILGIETSCDETAAAVVADGRRVLSNAIASQHDLHAQYSGVVPELASRAHVEKILPVVRLALEEAGLGLGMIDAVAVGNRPGLIGSLVVGVAAAKALAWSLGRPLVGVDHVHAHLYSGMLEEDSGARTVPHPDPRRASGPASKEGGSCTGESVFPALGLVVSGGHTSMYLLRSWTELERLGATIDDAIGEAFDKAATILGIPYPGGPNLDALARTPGANDRAHEFPISRIAPGSLDFSFSGLKTSLLYRVRGVPQGGRAPRDPSALAPPERADLAASFQRAAVRALMIKLERALPRAMELAGLPARTLLVGGGVSANSRLRRELAEFAAAHALEARIPRMEYCMDNAAMIAGLAHELLAAGRASDLALASEPTTAC